MSFSTASIYFLLISTIFIFVLLPLSKLPLKLFLLYGLPWSIFNTIWVFYSWGYVLLTVFITIICYYYRLRIHQLDFYAKWLMKHEFDHLNHRIGKLLKDYDEVINEVNQFNKFASKLIFFCIFIPRFN